MYRIKIFFRQCRNVLRWLPVIWRDRDWDQHYFNEILIKKLEKAVLETGIKEVAIAGGVSSNSGLRNALNEKTKEGWKVHIPKFEYCTDNAAMIAITGKFLFEEKQFANQSVAAKARMEW